MIAPQQRSFRTALLILVIGSLLVTVAVIGSIGFSNSLRSLKELQAIQYDLTAQLMRQEARRLLYPPTQMVAGLVAKARQGSLPVETPERLAADLGGLLRYQPDLAWLSYSDAATGQFTGAWRNSEGEIILNLSHPDVEGGRPREWLLLPGGTFESYSRTLPDGYDPRTKPWFVAAAASRTPVWSDIYLFEEGEPGITYSQAVRRPITDELMGVVTADFTLDGISRFLDSLGRENKRLLLFATPAGAVIGKSSNLPGADGVDAQMSALLAALPEPLDQIAVGQPLHFSYRNDGMKLIAIAARDEDVPGFPVITMVAADENQFLGSVIRNARMTVITGFGALLTATLVAFFLAARMARPLAAISADLARVAQFDLARQPPAQSLVREITVVGESVERMKAGLRSFSKYVPTTLVRRLLAHGQEAELGGSERELTIFFADLAGFTSISEQLTPAETVETMREYFELATVAVETHEGTLDKFLGDGVLAFFNAPLNVPDHAIKACEAALMIRDKLVAAEPTRQAAGQPLLRVRIGMATGEVLVGNIGTNDRFAYTVVGDTANLAARLESLNKQYGTRLIAAGSTVQAVGSRFVWRQIDRVAVVGRSGGTDVYELLARQGEVRPEMERLKATYETALAAYYSGDFSAALAGFESALALAPEDKASRVLLSRVQALLKEPPAPGTWDGIFIAAEK